MLNTLLFIVNNGWKYYSGFVKVKVDSNLTLNFLMGEWSPADKVMTELVFKNKVKKKGKDEG